MLHPGARLAAIKLDLGVLQDTLEIQSVIACHEVPLTVTDQLSKREGPGRTAQKITRARAVSRITLEKSIRVQCRDGGRNKRPVQAGTDHHGASRLECEFAGEDRKPTQHPAGNLAE